MSNRTVPTAAEGMSKSQSLKFDALNAIENAAHEVSMHTLLVQYLTGAMFDQDADNPITLQPWERDLLQFAAVNANDAAERAKDILDAGWRTLR